MNGSLKAPICERSVLAFGAGIELRGAGGGSRASTSNDRAHAHAQHARLTQCGGNRGRILHHEPREHAGGVEAKAEECHERASNGEAAESLGD